MQTVGAQIRKYRERLGLSQRELGDQVGRLQQEIYRFEKGIVRVPADDLPALARALHIQITDFFPRFRGARRGRFPAAAKPGADQRLEASQAR